MIAVSPKNTSMKYLASNYSIVAPLQLSQLGMFRHDNKITKPVDNRADCDNLQS